MSQEDVFNFVQEKRFLSKFLEENKGPEPDTDYQEKSLLMVVLQMYLEKRPFR